MKSLFLGAYWKGRGESRRQAAARISAFLCATGAIDLSLSCWFQKGSRKASAFKPAALSSQGIEPLLKSNNRDITGDAIADLGYNIGLWNGENASFSATVGATSPYIENSIVLSFQGDSPCDSSTWRKLMEQVIEAFAPDSAVVTSHEYIARHGDQSPDEAGGWFTYRRGESIREHEFA